jgi:ubiquinone/menaquinone biosynthesis C-methylase UbiE
MGEAADFETLSAKVHAGQAVYSPGVLRLYDWFVLGISNRFVWRCPTRHLEELYRAHLSRNHLDVGAGTGYFLDRCGPLVTASDASPPRIVLMDLNPNCLQTAAVRIARYRPQSLQRNVLEPIRFEGAGFDSIALNYVLHCLPGTMAEKSAVFDHLRPLLAPGGVICGSTILAGGVAPNLMARQLMAAYNRKGIFGNRNDSLEALQAALARRFESWEVQTRGCVALFWGR